MTLEEFQKFVEQQIAKQRKAKQKEAEATQRMLDNQYRNITGDKIISEGGHYVAIRDGIFFGSYDTKGEAWRELYPD